jgi:hypothetical protein
LKKFLWQYADKRRVSELLGLRGTTAIRLTWGMVQEPSSLHILMQMFPYAILEEVRVLPTLIITYGAVHVVFTLRSWMPQQMSILLSS